MRSRLRQLLIEIWTFTVTSDDVAILLFDMAVAYAGSSLASLLQQRRSINPC